MRKALILWFKERERYIELVHSLFFYFSIYVMILLEPIRSKYG